MISRREFAATLATSASLLPATPNIFAANADLSGSRQPRRKRVAILCTIIKKYSHAQHFVDRFLEGYGWEGRHHHPPFDVSLYVDQHPEGDLTDDRVRRHGVRVYPTVAEALTLGTSKLAVDGVLIIGEHGDYPVNERGQTLYPRFAWFKEIVKVFEASGRSVPVFNDKHLSTNWAEADEMVRDSKRLGFPFMAGSSLPVTWRIPSLDLPMGTALSESVAVCYGGIDSYDFHGFETAQCMSERRAGGETGVQSVQALQAGNVWRALRNRELTGRLLLAALCRSETLKPPPGYTYWRPTLDWIQVRSPKITAFLAEHRDGLRTTVFLLNGDAPEKAGKDYASRLRLWNGRLVRDFTYAGADRDGRVTSCKFHLPMPPYYTTLANFFNPLVHHVGRMILTGRTPYPVERTLLTTGMTAAAIDSLHRGQVIRPTPELDVRYQATGESTHWRA